MLLCPDRPSWSFDNIAINISRSIDGVRIDRLYAKDFVDEPHVFFETVLRTNVDLCHLFWREDLFFLFHPHTVREAANRLGISFESLVRGINSCAFTTSVYDHLFSEPEELLSRRTGFALTDGYSVSSNKLMQVYNGIDGLPEPDMVIPDGVDIDRFSPSGRPQENHGTFKIGWAGNSQWGRDKLGFDVKGFDRIFKPMSDILRKRGIEVEERIADPHVNRIPFDEMPDFYAQLDLFVCTSAMEGTPNPVLEAMASGVPVISTDVGIVPEVFGDLQQRFIIRDPQPDRFADAASELHRNLELRRAIIAESRSRALEWSWTKTSRDWKPFWETALRRAMSKRNAKRRETLLLLREKYI